ncbi:MAG: hypothetical protein ABIS27_04920, partial [Longimicrobiales bacterium]
ERDGYKAIISGDVKQVAGASYLLSARVLSAQDSILVAFSETAKDSTDLIPAVHRLSRTMREKMGESLKTIRAEKPLAQVTTASLPAFRKYSEAIRVGRETADVMREKSLLIEAVQLDTLFASAWRRLGVVTRGDSGTKALTRAFDLRDHLTDLERFQTIAAYESGVRKNRAAAMDAHRQALAVDSLDVTTLNAFAAMLAQDRRWAEAEVLLRRAKRADADGGSWSMLWVVQYWQGHIDEAKATLDSALVALPNNIGVYFGTIVWAGAQQKWDLADSLAIAGLERFRDNRSAKPFMSGGRILAANAQGRLAAANAMAQEMRIDLGMNDPLTRLNMDLEKASMSVYIREDIPRAKREIQAALRAVPLASLPDERRPYDRLSNLCGAVADFVCADDAMRGLERQKPTQEALLFARGYQFLHKGNAAAALPLFQELSRIRSCNSCMEDLVAMAWMGLGKPDSALAGFERYLNAPEPMRYYDVDVYVNRLLQDADLHVSAGNKAKAIERYAAVLKLWQKADAEFQPRVDEVRKKIARLQGKG